MRDMDARDRGRLIVLCVARGFDLVGMDIVENLITLGWIVVEMK